MILFPPSKKKNPWTSPAREPIHGCPITPSSQCHLRHWIRAPPHRIRAGAHCLHQPPRTVPRRLDFVTTPLRAFSRCLFLFTRFGSMSIILVFFGNVCLSVDKILRGCKTINLMLQVLFSHVAYGFNMQHKNIFVL